jgi:hypothetical protein
MPGGGGGGAHYATATAMAGLQEDEDLMVVLGDRILEGRGPIMNGTEAGRSVPRSIPGGCKLKHAPFHETNQVR